MDDRVLPSSRTPRIAYARTGFRGLSATARLVLGLLVLGFVAAGLYLVPTYAAYGLAFLGLGAPLLVLLWFRPEFGLLAIILLTSSFLAAETVDVRLPIGGGLDLRDLILLGMFGLLSFRELVRKTLIVPWRSVGAPLLVFLGFALVSGAYALLVQGVEANWALNDLRILTYYALFFMTGWAIARQHQLTTVLTGLFLIADLTATIVLVQQFLGAENRLLAAMSDSHWRLWEQNAASGGLGLVRVVPPGHVLMYFMMVIALGLIVFIRRSPRLRAVMALQFVYLNVGLLLTYTRAQWIAAAIALGLIFIALFPAYRAQFARYLMVGIPVVVLVLSLSYGLSSFVLEESTDIPPFANALAERALSIFRPSETLESSSLQWRVFETQEALHSIREHPLLGVGLGNRYRDLTLLRGEARGLMGGLASGQLSRFTRYIHNSYLAIAAKMGVPALISFLWFCGAFLVKGWQLYCTLPESQLRGIVLAVLAGFLGLLQWSILHSHFMEVESTSAVGLMVGLIAGIQHLPRLGLASYPTHNRERRQVSDGQ